MAWTVLYLLALASCLLPQTSNQVLAAAEGDLRLQELVEEALHNNPEVLVAHARTTGAMHRVPQATALPDPMAMVGYQNEGYRKYTFGEMPDAQWMFSYSQMIPFYGKRGLKGEMAARDADSQRAMTEATKLRIVSRVKELYYDLFYAYKTIDLLRDKAALFSRVEEAALARYASGMGPQQEVLMAQTEKYMLLEKEEMQNQKIQAIEGMLNTTVGRDLQSPLGRPSELPYTSFTPSVEDLAKATIDRSPEIASKRRMAEAAEAKLKMAKKEYYPDFTVAASLFKRNWDLGNPPADKLEDMWSVTTSFNIPLFNKRKLDEAVLEAKAGISEANREIKATEYMLSSAIRDNYSMVRTAEKLMTLYREGLIPKTYQDFELAIAGYVSGKVEAITAVSRLKALLDFELLYWGQQTEREKAIARLEAITGVRSSEFGPFVFAEDGVRNWEDKSPLSPPFSKGGTEGISEGGK